ncbi:AAA family ATPase [Tardiphaga sp.]|uniref:AAA family ATPase n=1 Tax=Tardiphaga sp. TaxID=1926292 RepID=UPI00261AE5E9|nr:AAA family ATPase [Tardiphaga sp.]
MTLRRYVAEGQLDSVTVKDRILEVAELHEIDGDPAIALLASDAPDARPADSQPAADETFPEDDEPIEAGHVYMVSISPVIDQALESWDRVLANVDRQFLARQFTRAATEILRLKSRQDEPEKWLQLIDALHAMGQRHGLSVAVVQGLMAAATSSPLDERPGAAAQPIEEPRPPEEDRWAPAEAPYFDDGTTGPAIDLVTPQEWRDVPLPPMQWLATNRIPAGDATILSGDGGGGKTTVALQLAISVERGLGDWLGTTCEAGPVIFVSAEEPENEMRRRLERVARKRGIEPDEITDLYFNFASPENCLLGTALATGAMAPTPLFTALAAAAAAIRPVLIIVDSIAGTFGGNQNDRVHARTFVGMFRRLAQDVECAVLLLDHPSLSGITSGSGRGGSMDWQNATRARLHLETVTADDGTTGRVLEVKKSNYGPVGDKVSLRWEEGSFVMEGSEGSQASPVRAAAQRDLDDLFVRLLEERNTQGRWVTPNKAAGYAPKELATMQGASNVTATALARSMERLLTANRITTETFGPPSKQRQRLVVTPSNRLPTGE